MKAQTMKRLATLGIAATLSCGVFSSPEMISGVKDELAVTAYAAEASGTCGTNLKWSLSYDTLTITGTGTVMENYSTSFKAPWYAYRNQIKTLKLPGTLKELGNYAFYNMDQLRYISTKIGSSYKPYFSPSLKKIGMDCFYSCDNLQGRSGGILNFGTSSAPLNDLTIGTYAFACCGAVKKINLYSKSADIEQRAFASIYKLSELNLDVENLIIESVAFNSCYSLSRLTIDANASINTSAFNGTPYRPYAVAVGHASNESYDSSKGWPEKVAAYSNRERVVRGIAPLKYCSVLARAAQVRAEELPDKFSHKRPDGNSFSTAISEQLDGANLSTREGENIAAGYISAWDVMYARPTKFDAAGYPLDGGWMYSFEKEIDGVKYGGHRDCILDPDFQYIGCGVTRSEEYNVGITLEEPYFWSQEFMGNVSGYPDYRNRFDDGYVVIARGPGEAPWPLTE